MVLTRALPDEPAVERTPGRRARVGVGLLLLGALFAFLVIPFAPLVLWSLAGSWFHPDLLPTTWSLDPWREALRPGGPVPEALANSLLVAAVAATAAVAVGTPAAMVLGRERFRGKRLVELLVLAPLLVPPFAVALGVTLEFLDLRRLGIPLYRTFAGVVLAHLVPTLPYVIRVLQAAFEALGTDLERSARSLGATPLRAFFLVTVPALRGPFVVAAFFAFLVSLGTYLLTFLVGGGLVPTLPTLLFADLANLDRPAAAVTSVLFMLPGLLYLLVTERLLRTSRIAFDFPVG